MEKEKMLAIFDQYCKKLRITPVWDVKLELIDDPEWQKTGDFKIDCDDRKASRTRPAPLTTRQSS